MIETTRGFGGACVAPQHQAAAVGRDVLKDGGDALEAMVAMAAAIAVTYPHMNSLGGDGFWLIKKPGQSPIAIHACGPAAAAANLSRYKGTAIPARGPEAALTVAGTVSGWMRALEQSAKHKSSASLPLSRLLAPAEGLALEGVAVSRSQSALTQEKLDQLVNVPGFAETYLVSGNVPEVGHRLRQPRLAATLAQLAHAGLDDFYRGDIGRELAHDLAAVGSPVSRADLQAFEATVQTPLRLPLRGGTLYNLAPPTQGLASLLIMGQFDRLYADNPSMKADSFEHLHALVEATKQAFRVRSQACLDPAFSAPLVNQAPEYWLSDAGLEQLVADIDRAQAAPWPHPTEPGDTVWMGCVDADGLAVSFIQSLYWEFGSGVCLPQSGLMWQNRGMSFSLDPAHPNALMPGKLPFHTLNPALAEMRDGRVMPYGTMGGEGQPQTQSAVFSRHMMFGQSLQQAVSAPRWLLGRTWGDDNTRLKLENRFTPEVVAQLRAAGHDIEVLNTGFADQMGHAGALVKHPNGLVEGAVDPRSDGAVALT